MDAPPIRNSRRALSIWAAILLVVFLGGVAFNVWLGGYADARRARDPRTYIARATQLTGNGNLSGAMSEIGRALQLDPDSPDAHAVLGHIHYRQKEWEKALAAYQKAIQYGSRAVDVRQHSVWALIELERYEEAIHLGANAIAAGFTSPVLPRYVAEAYYRSRRFQESIPYFEKALESYPDDQHLMDKLRVAYANSGEMEKAERIRSRIAETEASRNLDLPQ